jgi:hypothetical protein
MKAIEFFLRSQKKLVVILESAFRKKNYVPVRARLHNDERPHGITIRDGVHSLLHSFEVPESSDVDVVDWRHYLHVAGKSSDGSG